MFQSSLPERFWPYSLMTATWMINRLPSRVLDCKTPYEVLFGAPPDLTIRRPFGCLAYAANVTPRKRKFDSRSHKCAFVGYDMRHKGYLLYDLSTHRVFTSRDVKFFTNSYPFSIPAEDEQMVEDNLPLVEIIEVDAATQCDEEESSSDTRFSPAVSDVIVPAIEPPPIADVVPLSIKQKY